MKLDASEHSIRASIIIWPKFGYNTWLSNKQWHCVCIVHIISLGKYTRIKNKNCILIQGYHFRLGIPRYLQYFFLFWHSAIFSKRKKVMSIIGELALRLPVSVISDGKSTVFRSRKSKNNNKIIAIVRSRFTLIISTIVSTIIDEMAILIISSIVNCRLILIFIRSIQLNSIQ